MEIGGVNGRHISVNLDQHPIRQSKFTVVGHKFGRSKIMVKNHNMDGPKMRYTTHNRPTGWSKIRSHRWFIGPLSIWMVKVCKFAWSKLRHLDRGARISPHTGTGSQESGVSRLARD